MIIENNITENSIDGIMLDWLNLVSEKKEELLKTSEKPKTYSVTIPGIDLTIHNVPCDLLQSSPKIAFPYTKEEIEKGYGSYFGINFTINEDGSSTVVHKENQT